VGRAYKRVPQGYSADHPGRTCSSTRACSRIGRLPAAVLASLELVEACYDICAAQAPLQQWLLETCRRSWRRGHGRA